VDVNGGWTDKKFALDTIHWLQEQNVLFVEQPMGKENLDDHRWLTGRSPLPVLADESCQRLGDVKKLEGIFSGINIKLMKCTGLNEARKMIEKAREIGMKVLMGCMSETSCAVSAAAQIAPLCDWADLDGPLLIRKDYFSGVKFAGGKLFLNDRPGIGASPAEELFP
jgi:L-alanine-DL-glutamate epimerase-like enolase superfamily enzyme